MRSLLFHCKNYETKIHALANRPPEIIPEKIQEEEQNCVDCVVALITVEYKDNIEADSAELVKEIAKMSKEVNRKEVVIVPFAHLSNKLAPSKETIKAIDLIERELQKKFNVIRAHFGSHKELLLNLYGHPGNARYREFYL